MDEKIKHKRGRFKMNEFKFLEEIEDCLDEQFPKGKCKERGQALVLYAVAQIEYAELQKAFNIALEENNRLRGDYNDAV